MKEPFGLHSVAEPLPHPEQAAVTWDEVREARSGERLWPRLLPPDSALASLGAVRLHAAGARAFVHGQAVATGERVTGLLVDYHLDRGNGIAAIRDIRRRFGDGIPAILITADRSPHVRAAAREENIAVLNKPVKPASLRALLGQWRTQQMVAAE